MNEDDILDYQDYFGEGEQVVLIRYFAFATQAHLAAARLREEGIPCFVSNATIGNVLPLGGSMNVSLHVRSSDTEAANELLLEMDQQAKAEQDFRDADEEDIAFERSLHESKGIGWWWLVVLIIVFLLLRSYLRGADAFWQFLHPF